MLRMQIKIGGMEVEIDQGRHVLYRDEFGNDVSITWEDLSDGAKEEIKNTIIGAENLIRLSANTIWS